MSNWTRDEHIVAFNLYCKVPFSKISHRNRDIQNLASTIGRSSNAVAMKLANFARLDPALQARNISGLQRGAKGEEEIWMEFAGNWDELAYASERILAQYVNKSLEESANIYTGDLTREGLERDRIVRTRVNQAFFRNSVLASYNFKCCITGLSISELLVAGHIIPWSVDPNLRTNPSNGVCLNALYDRAFDRGLMTITPDYKIKFSEKLFERLENKSFDTLFYPFEGEKIRLPQKFYPQKEFLEFHGNNIFIV